MINFILFVLVLPHFIVIFIIQWIFDKLLLLKVLREDHHMVGAMMDHICSFWLGWPLEMPMFDPVFSDVVLIITDLFGILSIYHFKAQNPLTHSNVTYWGPNGHEQPWLVSRNKDPLTCVSRVRSSYTVHQNLWNFVLYFVRNYQLPNHHHCFLKIKVMGTNIAQTKEERET